MSYALYVGYHLLFMVAAVTGAYRSRLAIVAYIAACIPMALLTDMLVPAADLNWYRTVFEDLSSENILIFILANDFEAFWGIAVLFTKAVLPSSVATLGACSMLLLLLPLCWRTVRQRVEYLSILMIFPGSFLIMFNTMRQGFSEYFVLASMLSGSLVLTLLAGLTHRFGFVVGLIARLARWTPPIAVLLPALLIGLAYWRLLSVFSPENDMQAIYAQLSPNYASFALKMALYALPYAAARFARARQTPAVIEETAAAWRSADRAFLIISGVTLISVLVHPRLADRIAFYVLPVSLWALSRSGAPRLTKALFYCAVMILGLGSMFLGSHREFFDPGIVVTDELEHGE